MFLCLTVRPKPPTLYPPHTEAKEQMSTGGREWVGACRGEVKPAAFLISQSSSSVMEEQRSRPVLRLSGVYTCSFSPSSCMFTKRVSRLTPHHTNPHKLSQLFYNDVHNVRLWERHEKEFKSGRETLTYHTTDLLWHAAICFPFCTKVNGSLIC